MSEDRFDRVLNLLWRLRAARIHHEVASYREGAISVVVRVPGEYWEIDFLANGGVDVERFVSNGTIEDESALDELFARFSDEEAAPGHDPLPRK
jgi:hypothetical protein